MKYVYIVLLQAHTGLGQMARILTHYDYTHAAVCLDKRLTDFVTYSRRRHYAPLDAGFMHEYRDYYAFGKYRRVKAKVFRIPVGSGGENILRFISQCENDTEQMFNLFSMMTMPVFHGFPVYKAHNCMSFTAKIIALSGAVEMNKPYYKYSIKDIDRLLHQYVWFEGNLRRMTSREYKGYMEKPPFWEPIKAGVHTVFTLVKRMLMYGRAGDGL